MAIHPETSLGPVTLTVANIDRSLDYYQNGLGLRVQRREGGRTYLGAGGPDLLVLEEQPGARPLRGHTGLYHFALLLPDRPALGQILKHFVDIGHPIAGWSDHAVSEAIYLRDPDYHGIEIYRDRPRDEWVFNDGEIYMTVDPFDSEGVMAAWPGATNWDGLPAATIMGHMHLHVAHIARAEAFYHGVLGLDIMTRYGGGASFLAAGGYHHHLGMNTWAGVGAPPPPPDGARLLHYQINLPNKAALDETLGRLDNADIPFSAAGDTYLVRDPAQNGIILAATGD